LVRLDTLDDIKISLDETKKLLQDHVTLVTQLQEDVAVIKDNHAEVSNHLAVHDREISMLKITANANQQLLKINTARVIGYPVSTDEVAAAAASAADLNNHLVTAVFNRILCPVFTAAVESNFIQSVPTPAESIQRIYRAGRAAVGSSPPPIIIVFHSYTLRQAIFRFKAKVPFKPNTVERSFGAKKVFIVEDLTRDNHKMLKDLQSDERISKVWTVEGLIRFTKVDDTRVYKVANVYQSVESIVNP